ncbi:MAG: hypothetical protein K2I00_03015 [Ruminococcus sp.]|nr:hypothetical protein [Ruminococcus sp.]
MKRKTRTITVNDNKYVWWYRVGAGLAEINLSPVNDKTSVITVNFLCDNAEITDKYEKYIGIGKYPEYITVQKDYSLCDIKTVSPKMAAFILSHLKSDDFVARKYISYNGFDLLEEWGFVVNKITDGIYWEINLYSKESYLWNTI